MIIGHIPGYTRKLGEAQGYLGLPVKDVLETAPCGSQYPLMQTLWHPTAEDLRALIAGGGVVLTILGTGHPPVRVECVSPETFDPFVGRAESPETGTTGAAEMAEKE